MKHSSSSSMSESCQPRLRLPCSGDCESVLQNLYIDLFNLIVESRVPGLNDRGYGDGSHCPPLLGPNQHMCDLLKPECQKHERLIHHLLKATRHYVFEIEVLMLPDCCSDLKLTERIQDKEYLLLERWSMKCSRYSTQATIEISELLRAVRSFLHFSQLSAWLSLTKGKSPSNIYYWVKPTFDAAPSQFECNPEVHSFPTCRISDELNGIIEVKYPERTQYIPIIPCSKHPLHPITFRTISTDSSLSESIALTPGIVKQFQKSCENTEPNLISKCCSTDSQSLFVTPTSVLKTLIHDSPEENKAKRIKLSNSQKQSQSTEDFTSNLFCHFQMSKISEISPKATLSKYTSHENLCFINEKLSLSGKEPKLKMFNNDVCSVLSSTKKNLSQESSIITTNSCALSSNVFDSQLCSNTNTFNFQIENVKPSHLPTYSKNLVNSQVKRQKTLKLNKRKQHASAIEPNIPCNKRRKTEFNNTDPLLTSSPELIQSTSLCQKSTSKTNKKNSYRYFSNLKRTSKLIRKRRETKNDLTLSIQESNKLNFCRSTCFEPSTPTIAVSTKLSSNTSVENESEPLLNEKDKSVPNNEYSSLCRDQSASISKPDYPDLFHNVLHQKINPLLVRFPRHKLKSDKRRKLLGNFEESILQGCLVPVNDVDGFHVEIGASGSFYPNHITLPAKVTFYELDSSSSGVVPYMAQVTLADEYYLPKKGAVQVTLFNPSETVVKMFVLNYDLSEMPPMCHTFIRQKTYYMPIGSTEECPSSQKWLRFIIHLRFASSKTGKIYLYKDFKIVVLNRSNDDAASEFSQEPRELRSFLHVPMNPAFSNL